jgi:Flp pilus assembly protein TadD
MSVLYKALQKAEKENEQRQPTSGGIGFDPQRLAGSGAIKFAGGRGINWRTAGLTAAGVLAVAIAAAFFLVQPPASSPQVAAVAPAVKPVPGTTEAIPVLQPPPAAPAAAPTEQPQQVAGTETPATPPVAETPASASAAITPAPAVVQASAADAPVALTPPAPQVAAAAPPSEPVEAAPAPAPPLAAPAQSKPAPAKAMASAAPRREPMPDIGVNSPARMLNPPIAINRNEFALSGVGNAVQVREVSQQAQNNVGAGYNALVNGSYDTALGFYDRALKDEPTSVLALLGRAAALHKIGRKDEAQDAYNRVLKLDPSNREALSNVIAIVGDRSPAEALTRLLELEREYPGFSPVKAQIGLAYAKMGTMPEALTYLSRAVAMSPESVMYQYNLALVLDHLGRREQAVAAYQTVLAALSGGRASPELSATDIERRVRYLRVQ